MYILLGIGGLDMRFDVQDASIGPRTEICGIPSLPLAMEPCLHQSNVYIKYMEST